ncbi:MULTISPECIES: hypothetical protein [unclassified Rhizobium]|uniref:hypothetical protein n=1 Tax=unclassified Rhizobium TaxID=2613769 RepID=UPI000378616A|nr:MULTISPECIES: hypothetical protein [unclassified Rhizobium]MBD9448244.1 hypothetical protein [Rhizobium sp. RHZ01]MBD9454836.1 hypothetical protein [Rhizobium sp. RHZ02]
MVFMGKENDGLRTPSDAERRGLHRLMLKLPSVRGRLQLIGEKSESLGSLCEAYEDASSTLDRLRSSAGDMNHAMVHEYEMVCAEIEADVIKYCRERGGGGLE